MMAAALVAWPGSGWVGALLGGAMSGGVVLTVTAVRHPAGTAAARRQAAAWGLRPWLVRSGVQGVSPTGFMMASLCCAALFSAAAQAVSGVPALAVAGGCACGALPGALVGWRGRLRRGAARAAWPDVVDHLVAAVRSGIALPEAVAALAVLGPEATHDEFRRFGHEYRTSGDFAGAIDGLKGQLADPVFDRIAETLKMAREVGGTELVSVLRALAGALREDAAMRGELQARQTWVVNAARLGVAAPWLVLAMLTTRPEGREAYGTLAGTVVIVIAATVTVVAYRVMLAVGRLPQERRWFR